MALAKATFVDLMSDELGSTQKQATEVTESLLEIIKATLAAGDDVLVSNFVKICVKDKKERKGAKSGHR
jgi:integration host factor subunit alpha